MKKFLLSILFVSILASGAYSQAFIGGSVGFQFSGGSEEVGNETTSDPNRVSYGIIPRVGFMLSDNFALGGIVGLTRSFTVEEGETNDTKYAYTAFNYGIFARLYMVQSERFDFFGEFQVVNHFGKNTTKYGDRKNDGYSDFGLDINVAPGFALKITNTFSLESKLNFLGAGFYLSSSKSPNDNDAEEIRYRSASTYIGMNSFENLNVSALNPALSLGFVWKLGGSSSKAPAKKAAPRKAAVTVPSAAPSYTEY